MLIPRTPFRGLVGHFCVEINKNLIDEAQAAAQ